MTTEQPKEIKPGQVYFSLKAVNGWRYLRVDKVVGEFVYVTFLEPLPYWGAKTTGAIERKELIERYRLTNEKFPVRKQKR